MVLTLMKAPPSISKRRSKGGPNSSVSQTDSKIPEIEKPYAIAAKPLTIRDTVMRRYVSSAISKVVRNEIIPRKMNDSNTTLGICK